MDKLASLDELRLIVEKSRQAAQTVVLANGCFDLLHVGHIRYLQGARQLGDRLIVALNTDRSVSRLKGPQRPLMSENERAEILAALSCVDHIVIFDEPTVEKILLALKPDIHCKGTDYSEETVPEREVVLSYGGRTAIVGDPKDHSTRDFIREIVKRSQS